MVEARLGSYMGTVMSLTPPSTLLLLLPLLHPTLPPFSGLHSSCFLPPTLPSPLFLHLFPLPLDFGSVPNTPAAFLRRKGDFSSSELCSFSTIREVTGKTPHTPFCSATL